MNLFRTVIWAGFVGVLGFGVWEVRHAVREHEQALAQRDEHIATLEQDIEEAGDLIAELQLALQFVKVDHRLATLEVLSQERQADDPNGWWTVVRFQEIDAVITGLTRAPITLTGRYTQTYNPAHHNFNENFVFDPFRQEGIDPAVLEELGDHQILLIICNTTPWADAGQIQVLRTNGKLETL